MNEEPILIGDEYISQVRTFGALGYSVNRICTLLQLTKKQKVALSIRMSLPGDVYYEAYRNGKAIGEYNIDSELAKQAERGNIEAITLLEERKQERVEVDLRQQLFGV
jgi:hypothetical protein